MFDVFYHGPKPNLFAHERPATTLEQARRKSHTRFFWYIDGSKDLREFDFTWCVAPWEQHQTHIFLLNSQFEAFSVVFAPTDDLPVVEHYHERQYLPRRTEHAQWKILAEGIDWSIDPDWVPNPYEPPYIYAFKNKWFPRESVVAEYHVPGATEYKYLDDPVLTVVADPAQFKILKSDVHWNIDPAWVPNPFDPPFVYAFKSSQYTAEEVVAEYHVPGATEYKFVDEEVFTLTTNRDNWGILKNEGQWHIDPAWAPNPHDPPYIYAFRSRWFNTEEVVAEYHVPGATEYKFIDEEVVKLTTDQRHWRFLKPEFKWTVDPAWAPNPYDPPYIYVFGNKKWFTDVEVVAEYHVPGATERKYIDENVVSITLNKNHWNLLYSNADVSTVGDWSPNPFDPPYVYVFGNQTHSSREMPTAEYRVPGALEYKYVDEVYVALRTNSSNWVFLKDEAQWQVDPLWAPDPTEPPYIYVFGNPWYGSVDMPTAEYHVPGAVKYKYMDQQVLSVRADSKNWRTLKTEAKWNIDSRWAPNPFEPPYIYVFGNPWYTAVEMPTAEYHVPGATERKYIDDQVLSVKADDDCWKILKSEVEWQLDKTWAPNPFEPAYIYVFGNPWYTAVEMPTVEYRVPGAVELKYMDEQVVSVHADRKHWNILKKEADWKIDPNWAPNPFEPPYIHVFGNPWYSAIEMPTAEYRMPGATDYKYNDTKVLTVNVDRTRWKVLKGEVDWQIDYSWAPNPFEPAYIYVFGNPWYTAVEMPSVEYHVPGATEYKYCDDQVLTVKKEPSRWRILKPEANWSVDMDWMPNPFEPPYIYIFGNPWYTAEEMPTVEYYAPGATERKYVDESIVSLKANPNLWTFLRKEAEWRPDPAWTPNPFEPPYIYVFGNQWYSAEEMPTAEYAVVGATERKYVTDVIVTVKPRTVKEQWRTLKNECQWDIDSNWMPNPFEEPYIYVFGNPWYTAQAMPTAEYHVAGATEYKYCDDQILTAKLEPKNWRTLFSNVDIGSIKSWRPNPFEPPYIYVFGNQWYSAEEMPTVEYHVPGATERKYILDETATLTPTRQNWAVPEEVNAGMIDFSWIPHPKETPYIYHFSSEFQMSVGLTYTVPGATDLKFETDVPLLKRRVGARLSTFVDRNAVAEDKSIVQTVDMFFVDMNNKMSARRYEALKLRYPDIQKIRYANGWLETIKRCLTRAKTQKFWVIGSENVYDDFNFEWHAQPWQNYMTHVFGSQWQKWSNTFLINKREFERHTSWAKSLDQFPNLNFVSDQPVVSPNDQADVYYIDWNNGATAPDNVKTTRFYGSYLETLNRICANAQDREWIWVTSGVCDYTRFDFSWYPEPWQADMLHVFPSDEQKFGDTFYLHVPTFNELSKDIELLDWFPKLNFCNDQTVRRLPPKEIVYNFDTAVKAVKRTVFKEPYAVFKHFQSNNVKLPTPNLWSEEYRTIIPVTRGGGITLVPREAGAEIDTQLYDYPYIEIGNEKQQDRPMDVIFISNGETNAERNWERLKSLVPHAKRIDGINGRSAAYKAALMASDTAWALCVFAKLYVDDAFDWNWQPDRLQAAKHYIFHAKNPVNGLEYGHMAMIAYNKDLVLNTPEASIVLDYTLAAEHEVVPVLSGVAEYNDDPRMTWRTAFREVIKLKYDQTQHSNWETDMRLDAWLNISEGKNGSWSTQGAQDAVEYFNSVGGALNKLQLSFDWAWLDQLWNNQGYK